SIKRLVKKQEIYDITVSSEQHNFIANGIVVHNTRAPEKRVITIPVGDIPAAEVDEYMVQQARRFKKRNYMDLGFNDVSSRWNPMIAQDDYFLPQRPDGVGPTITTLAGAENLDKIEDIEYFKKKMISALKIPFNRVGIGEQPNDAQQSLSQVAPEFAKSVQWIQREIISGLKKIAFVHLALKRFNEDEIRNFDINMTASSAIDELYRIETWSSRAGVIRDLLASGLPMEYVFKRFTDLSDDEIEKIKNQQQQQQQQQQGGGENLLGAMGESLEKLKFKFLNREEPAEINTENDYENYIINNELGDIPIDDESLLTEDIIDKDEINYLKEQAIKYLEEEYQEYIKELKQDYYYNVLHQNNDDEDEITEKDIPV
ncbi:MAG: portal protein, partial [Promethearchaeota archaeon]